MEATNDWSRCLLHFVTCFRRSVSQTVMKARLKIIGGEASLKFQCVGVHNRMYQVRFFFFCLPFRKKDGTHAFIHVFASLFQIPACLWWLYWNLPQPLFFVSCHRPCVHPVRHGSLTRRRTQPVWSVPEMCSQAWQIVCAAGLIALIKVPFKLNGTDLKGSKLVVQCEILLANRK